MSPAPPQSGFGKELHSYTRGDQVNVYLVGREKPLTGLTVCQVTATTLIARWNSSTHLIPVSRIAFVRYAPDADPCRRPDHKLHNTVRHTGHRPQKPQQPQQEASGAAAAAPVSAILATVLNNLKPLEDSKP
jgi:hypothetical protein